MQRSSSLARVSFSLSNGAILRLLLGVSLGFIAFPQIRLAFASCRKTEANKQGNSSKGRRLQGRETARAPRGTRGLRSTLGSRPTLTFGVCGTPPLHATFSETLSGKLGFSWPNLDSPDFRNSQLPERRRTRKCQKEEEELNPRELRFRARRKAREGAATANADEPKGRRAEGPRSRGAEEPKSRRAEEPRRTPHAVYKLTSLIPRILLSCVH
ncbi:uncharacterized protein [Equus przewalskii]|uniref:Uncharacterized protein isoform X2 n=1 Tax=Equus przewalskii TaxID=9798 RepID=A0ABM4QAQ7_EQUPR